MKKLNLVEIIGIGLLIVLIAIGAIKLLKGKEETVVQNLHNGNSASGENVKYDEEKFSFEFLRLENNQKNMIYSPLSIKYALKMLNEGASGNTKKQIDDLIGNLSVTKYNNIDKILSLANVAYIRDDYSDSIIEDYKDILSSKYNADIKYDEFADAKNINQWIEEKTFGQIKNMLRDELVKNPLTKMILINSLAIEIEWKNSFDEYRTNGEKFYLNDGTDMVATMMHMESKDEGNSFYKDENLTVLAMELQQHDDEQMEFIAIMPENDLSNYVENFSKETYNEIIKKLKLASDEEEGIEISMPRFAFEYDLSLKNDLISLGVTDAFDEMTADFSNMVKRNELFVSEALHKANIDLSEKGVKAAATTSVVMSLKSAAIELVQKEKIEINKPFMYVIRDKKTDEIWFVGTVYVPNSWENDKAEYESYDK